MSTYVISDIHGCYEQFLLLLEKIGFCDTDRLILAGDYIDRGAGSFEMLQWLENCSENVVPLRGNHEEEFAAYTDLMLWFDKKEKLGTDKTSNRDTKVLYGTLQYYFRKNKSRFYFGAYGTVLKLLEDAGAALEDFCRWSALIRRMPYFAQCSGLEKTCIVVHAGYAECLEELGSRFSRLEDFYLYARQESIIMGGKQHAVIIAGHTPTIAEGGFSYNRGNVFRHYDPQKDCVFYDIDCGCVFRSRDSDAKLACIRLEDEAVFYV
ncbi:MAG: metallophosphoesterase [Eubacterium sp.]|nr:metallophosphoesterase [Eubacterium sp.]